MSDYEKIKYDTIKKKYECLLFNENELKKIYNSICNGVLKPNTPEMKRYLDNIAKKKLLLTFMEFLKEADEFVYTSSVGYDTYDALEDKHKYSENIKFGFGDSPKKDKDSAYVNSFIWQLESIYPYKIKIEELEREETKKQVEKMAVEAYQKEEDLFKPVRLKYEKYLEAYKLWCSKDSYWHSSHLKLLPSPEKYGLTEDDLWKLGYYSAESRNARLEDYRKAYSNYVNVNSFLKKMFSGGKMAPTPSDYGLENSEVFALEDGELLGEGRKNR